MNIGGSATRLDLEVADVSDTRIRATRSNIFIAVIQKNCGDSVGTIDNDAEGNTASTV